MGSGFHDRCAHRQLPGWARTTAGVVSLRHHSQSGLRLAPVVTGDIVLSQSKRHDGIGSDGKGHRTVVEPIHVPSGRGIETLLEGLGEALDVAGLRPMVAKDWSKLRSAVNASVLPVSRSWAN